ncbi:MAG: right-handed parallel beta-helix repeat-containing protein, partial [Bacillota bacterium]
IKSRILLCFLFVLALGVLLLPGVAAAGVYIGDGYYSTIQSAVDAAYDGDTLLIEEGSYAEDVVITGKSITLDVYNPGDEVTITGDGTNDALISIIGTLTGAVTINNLTLDGAGSYQDGVNIDLDAAGSVTLVGNTIKNCYAGVYIDDTSLVGLTMSNNTFEGNRVPVDPLITDPGTNTLNGRVDMFDAGGNPAGITQAIQEAVNRAADNSTLKVYPWTYKEQVVIGKPLSLISMGNRDNTIIDSTTVSEALPASALRAAAPAAPERVKPPGVEKTQREAPALPDGVQPQHPLRERPQRDEGDAAVPAVWVYGYPVTIQGFEITGLQMYYADGSTIKDNRFTRCDWDGAYLWDTDALREYNPATEKYEIVQPVVIENNIFTGNDCDGLYLDYSYEVAVRNNEFSGNGWEGLYTCDADGLILTGNTFTGNQGCGAYLYDTDNWEDWGDQRAEVTGNTFTGNAYEGLIVDYCYYLPVEDNTISGNHVDGLWLGDDSEYVDVTGNTITGNAWDGIYAWDMYGCRIKGNTVQGNGTGDFPEGYGDVYTEWVFAGIEVYECWDNYIEGNTIDGNKDAGLYLEWSGYNRIAKNQITNNGHADNAEFGKGYGGILAGDRYEYGDYYWEYNQVQFNNITGNTPYGLYITGYDEGYWTSPPSAEPPAFLSDSAVGKEVAARIAGYGYWAPFVLNWWGDASGPADENQGYYVSDRKGNLLGEGQAVVADLWCYDPWLSKPFDAADPGPVLALPVTSGWHLLSTPNTLGLNSWQDVVDLGIDLNASVILRYNSATKAWENCVEGATFDPQDAYFVKLNSGDLLPLAIEGNFTSPPTRTLQQGWNLVSLATDEWGMSVKDALVSAEQTPDGKRGYTQVVKPPFPGIWDESGYWSCTVNNADCYWMYPFEGYWAYMENADELAGFSTTAPLWQADEDWYWWYDMVSRVLKKD